MPYNRALRSSAVLLTTLALTTGVAACGDRTPSSTPSSTMTAENGGIHNEADVAFATQMIPHHTQALEMVTMTEGRTLDPQVQQLADEIRNAQTPEIETMTGWLSAWGEDVPSGHDMGDMSGRDRMRDMPGMMRAEEMQALQEVSDADFQGLWLSMMKKHHEGAIEMARTEQQYGASPDALALAGSIITAQQAEIDQIEQLS